MTDNKRMHMDDRRNIKLIIEFKGTDFHGFQFQNRLRTVEGCLRKAIKTMTGEDAVIYSSSRTDRGVHALNMPVNFRTSSRIHLYGMMLGLNSLLPRDLKIKSISEVGSTFHARRDAVEKTYLYKVFNFKTPSPLLAEYSWHIRSPMNLSLMRRAAKYLIGTHDFSAFRAADCDSLSTEREIRNITIRSSAVPFTDGARMINIYVTADAFLRNMVRIIAGTLVEIGLGKRSTDSVVELLERGDRREAGITAPACGLYLCNVVYP